MLLELPLGRRRPVATLACAALACAALARCTSDPAPGAGAPADAGALADPSAAADAGALADPAALAASSLPGIPTPPVTPLPPEPRCPPEMVLVARRLCVDRYEAVLLDKTTGMALSAYYPPSRRQAESIERTWSRLRFELGDEEARRLELPLLPAWQKQRAFEPRAVSRKGVFPQGYTTGEQAARACKNAGKRLCSLDEWRTACRGALGQQFPYGATYAPGRCNVFRERHPAAVLHNDLTMGHSDPRLNLVQVDGEPLLRKTGQTAACMSAWGDDAIADMVGNLDEWVDDPDGTFAGGFYSRATKEGCMATVTVHPIDYFDYSLGVRCCDSARLPADGATR